MSEPRRLVLLRHGQTSWNAALRVQGQTDVELDDTGVAQADAVAPLIAAMDPTALYSSDLSRARQTTEHLERATGLRATYDERLREFHLGDREGLTHTEYGALHRAEFVRFRGGEWDDIPGAETRAEVADRFGAVLKEAAAGLEPGDTAIVIAHGAAIRTAMCAWLGWPVEISGDFRGLANCGWVELEERRPDQWTLAAYNRTA